MRKCNGNGDCDNCHNMNCYEWIECDICGERINEEFDEVYGYGDKHYCEKCLLSKKEVFTYSKMIKYLVDSEMLNEYIDWLEITNAVKNCEAINFTADDLKKWLRDYIEEDINGSTDNYLQWYIENYEV